MAWTHRNGQLTGPEHESSGSLNPLPFPPLPQVALRPREWKHRGLGTNVRAAAAGNVGGGGRERSRGITMTTQGGAGEAPCPTWYRVSLQMLATDAIFILNQKLLIKSWQLKISLR